MLSSKELPRSSAAKLSFANCRSRISSREASVRAGIVGAGRHAAGCRRRRQIELEHSPLELSVVVSFKRARSLLEEMRAGVVTADVSSMNSGILACAKASETGHAMQLFRRLEASQLADLGTYNAILDAHRAQPSRARDLWKLGMERGFLGAYFRVEIFVPVF